MRFVSTQKSQDKTLLELRSQDLRILNHVVIDKERLKPNTTQTFKNDVFLGLPSLVEILHRTFHRSHELVRILIFR